MAFQRYVPRKKVEKTEKKKVPMAVIKPTGYISFDAATLEEFGVGEASHAILLFDPQKKKIGIEFTNDPKEEGALKVSRRRSTVGVRAPGFIEEFRFVLDKTVKCPVRHDPKSGLVLVDARELPRKRGRRKA